MTNKSVVLKIIEDSPSVELLKVRNRISILDFLLSTFNEDKTKISFEGLQNKLSDFMSHHKLSFSETNNDAIETYEYKAKNAIRDWTNKGFLTNCKNENGIIFYELSPHTNKTINWLQSLEKKDFVGADSKFKDILNKLKELVEFTNEDKEKRIEILEEKKLKIEQEIKSLKIGEDAIVFEEHEIIPRYQNLNATAKELLTDFKEVEENFKNITKDIYNKHSDQKLTKKDVLTFTFNALDDLKESHQGKSFYAFWRFLMDRNLQEEWNSLTKELYETLQLKGIMVKDSFLKSMKNYLHTSGNKVYNANDKMAAKLSRIIRDNNNENKELANKLIQEIKNYLTQISKETKKPNISITLEVNEKINIPFDKNLTFQPKEEVVYNNNPKIAESNIAELNQLDKIFNTKVIDKKVLRKRVREVLNLKTQTTLNEVIKHFGGIEKGLPELFAYFGIVKDFTHSFDAKKEQEIVFDKTNKKSIKVPEIILMK